MTGEGYRAIQIESKGLQSIRTSSASQWYVHRESKQNETCREFNQNLSILFLNNIKSILSKVYKSYHSTLFTTHFSSFFSSCFQETILTYFSFYFYCSGSNFSGDVGEVCTVEVPCLITYPEVPIASTAGAFFQKHMSPVLSSSFLYYSMVIRHLTDFSLSLLTWGAILAKPMFFHTSLSFLRRDLLMMFWISLVFLGFIHTLTSSCERMTGIRLWTPASSGVAALVRMMISFSGVQSPATRKWSPSLGLRLKGSFFWFHSKQPSMMTTHLFWMMLTNILFSISSQIRPLITMLYWLLWPQVPQSNSLYSSCSISSSLMSLSPCQSMQKRLALMTGMQVVGQTLQEEVCRQPLVHFLVLAICSSLMRGRVWKILPHI